MMNNKPQQKGPFVLAETHWKSVRDTHYDVALLPWGATEAHNYHLPYGTDNIQAEFVATESARRAWESGAKSVVLPVVPFGVNTGQMDIKLCINMLPSTQLAVLNDIVDVLLAAGIAKLIIVNGHGGNHFKQMIRELSVVHPAMFVCSIDWWKVVDAHQFFDQPGDHAGELETSCVMHIANGLVDSLDSAGDGSEQKFKLRGLREGWVTAQRQWSSVSKDTGVGDPAKASPRKGKDFLEAVCSEIGNFICELATADIDDFYE